MATATTETKAKKTGGKKAKRGTFVETDAGKINLDACDEATIDSALKEVALAEDGTKQDKVVRLAAYYVATYPVEQRLVCDPGCGGPSVEADAFCPFCGKGDEAPAASNGNGKSNGNGAHAAGPVPKLEGPPSGEHPAVVVAGPLGDYTVSDLDGAVERIVLIAAETGVNMHRLGGEIRKLQETEIWKLRTVDGKPKFRTFKQFCVEELGFSAVWTYQLMDIADAFTAKQVAQFGPTKLAEALKAPEHKRAEVVEQIERGASVRDVAVLVEKYRAREKGPTPEPTPPSKRSVSVVIKPGRKTLPMWKKGTKGEDLAPAKRLADEPWTELQLDNDVRLLARLVQDEKTGELKLAVEFRRMAAE